MPNKIVFKKKYIDLKGGTEATLNPDWCDGHHSQCMDAAPSCQKGGEDQIYKKYKKYKHKYKLLNKQ